MASAMTHRKAAQLFVVGNSRSGTTMLGRALGRHSNIHTFHELHFFEQQIDAEAIRARPPQDRERCVALIERLLTSERDSLFSDVRPGKYTDEARRIAGTLGETSLMAAYEAFLASETQHNDKQVSCEQTPRYLYYASEIMRALPDSFVIHMVRDPRDILLSQKNKWRRRSLGATNIPRREAVRAWANYHPYITANLWVSAIRSASQVQDHGRIATLRFEDLVNSPREALQGLCGTLGIEFEEDMLNVPHVGSSIMVDLQHETGISSDRSGHWRSGGLTDVEVGICEYIASREMEAAGYRLSGQKMPK
ncbi:MAG: sulfotransferase, partial [Gammaproteobacteria bacterium]|nr:sulfotransferase [Gammaproteobacteria bacterium]